MVQVVKGSKVVDKDEDEQLEEIEEMEEMEEGVEREVVWKGLMLLVPRSQWPPKPSTSSTVIYHNLNNS